MQVQIGLLILLFGLYYLSRIAIKKKNLNTKLRRAKHID